MTKNRSGAGDAFFRRKPLDSISILWEYFQTEWVKLKRYPTHSVMVINPTGAFMPTAQKGLYQAWGDGYALLGKA